MNPEIKCSHVVGEMVSPGLVIVPEITATKLDELMEENRILRRDLNDCLSARQTIFVRCVACTHYKEQNLICAHCGNGD